MAQENLEDLQNAILDNASGVMSASGNGIQVVQHRPEAQVAAAHYSANARVRGSGWKCLKPARVVPPSAVGPEAC